jgi:hypothetical protein
VVLIAVTARISKRGGRLGLNGNLNLAVSVSWIFAQHNIMIIMLTVMMRSPCMREDGGSFRL